MANNSNTVVHLHAGQIRTIGHKVVRYGSKLCGYVNTCQLLALAECAIVHLGNAVGQRYCGETGVGKCVVAH